MVELLARVGDTIFRYDNRTHTHVQATDLNPARYPDQSQLILVTNAGTWCGEPSGPINFIELKAPGRVGLVTHLGGKGGSYRPVSWTFELSADARDKLAQISENWIEHIHVQCGGRLTINSVTGRPVWHLDRGGKRTPDVIRDVLDAAFRGGDAAVEPDLLRHNTLALRGYWIALALQRLNPSEFQASTGLESERPPLGFDEFVRHLYTCSQCGARKVCKDGRDLLLRFDGSGRLLTRLRQLAIGADQSIGADPVDGDVWTLLKTSNATPDQRRAAIDALVQRGPGMLVDALPEMNRRWPVAAGSRAGAPFSALAWAALAGSRNNPPVFRKRQSIGRNDVIASGWSLAEADTMIRLFTHRTLNGNDSEATLAALALGELASRHSSEIGPPTISRTWSLREQASNPDVQAMIEATGARLLRFLLDAEAKRRLPLGPDALQARVESLWPALEGMPVGTKVTRNQMLATFERFEWLRHPIAQHMRRTDPECPLLDAFVYPIRMPPLERLEQLAQLDSANATAAEEAVLLLAWAWAALRVTPADVVPPLPTLDTAKVGGTLDYWRQFLWGATVLTGNIAHRSWPEIIARMLAAGLPAATENMGWMSLGASLRHNLRPTSDVAALAHTRALMLLREPLSLHDDQRLVSLLRVLAAAQPDTHLFADDWCQLTAVIAEARIAGQAQRCMNALFDRNDLAELLQIPEVWARFMTFIVDRDPYQAGTAMQLLFESFGIRDAVRWMFQKGVFKSYWSLPTVSWRAAVARDPKNLRQLTVDLMVDFTLRRVGVADAPQASLTALRSLFYLDRARAMDTARIVIQRQQFDVVLPWIRDLPTNVRLDDALLDQLATDLSTSAGQQLGYAIGILRDAEERGVMRLDNRWATITRALIAEAERSTIVESVAWALAGLGELPDQYRPPLGRFTVMAQRVIEQVGDFKSALMPLTLYLTAIAAIDTHPVEPERQLPLPEYITRLVEEALQSEPPPHVLDLVTTLLEDRKGAQLQPDVRASLVVSLSGAREGRMSANALARVRAAVHGLPNSPRDPEFRRATAALRSTLRDVEQALDFHLTELLVPLRLELDDVLDAHAGEVIDPDNTINAAIRHWSVGMIDLFVRLWRVWTIVGVRTAVSYADALLHDASHVSEDIDEIRSLIEQDMVRRIASRPQRHVQPWDVAHRVVVDAIARRGWHEVSVEQQVATAPAGGAERAPRFDPDDLAVICENLISNAIPHGGTRVIVDREQIEIVNIAPHQFTSTAATALETYLETGRSAANTPRINRGLKNVRRCLARNELLRITYRIVEPGDQPLETGRGMNQPRVAASVTWLPPRMREVRGTQ